MENQLIRGQVFDVLFNYAEKWGSICTESDCATVRDEICLRIDQSQFTADEAEDYINQEVEKRIAERMPSLDDLDAKLTEYLVGILDSVDFHEWLLSCLLLTQDQKKDKQQVDN